MSVSAESDFGVEMDQLGAEPVDLAAVHFNLARDPGSHVAERVDRDRLFVRGGSFAMSPFSVGRRPAGTFV